MKNLRYLAISAISVLLASCTLDMPKSTLGNEEDFIAPVLSSVADVVSDANTAGVEQVVYTWSSAEFGVSTQIQYSVYAQYGEKEALVGQSFSNSLAIGKGDLVGLLCNDLGAPDNTTVELSSYVVADIYGSETTASLKSGPVDYSVFTYLAPKRNMFLAGGFQGWSQFGTEFWETDGGSNMYKILVDVANGDDDPCYFKLVLNDGSWKGFDSIACDGWEVADPDNSDKNYSVPASGSTVWLTVNSKSNTISMEVVSKVGLIGDFNGWNEDEPAFEYDAAENVWVSPVVEFTDGGSYLIRLNSSWDSSFKFGDGVAASDEVEGGLMLTNSGSAANIPAPGTGSYIVKLHANRNPFVIVYEKQ